MPNWFVYSTKNNRSKKWITSSPIDPIFPVGANEDVLKDPDVSSLTGIPVIYWKHYSGSVVEMTNGEKALIDAEEISARKELVRIKAKDTINRLDDATIVSLYAVAKWFREELNKVRAEPNTVKLDITQNDMVQGIFAKIDEIING